MKTKKNNETEIKIKEKPENDDDKATSLREKTIYPSPFTRRPLFFLKIFSYEGRIIGQREKKLCLGERIVHGGLHRNYIQE